MQLESVQINRGESYIDFYHRIQQLRSILFAKLSDTTADISERQSKIYNNTAFNVFLYNLPTYLVRMVRLRKVDILGMP